MSEIKELINTRTTATGRLYKCPNCKNELSIYEATAYCDKCGAEYEIRKADEYDFNGKIYILS